MYFWNENKIKYVLFLFLFTGGVVLLTRIADIAELVAKSKNTAATTELDKNRAQTLSVDPVTSSTATTAYVETKQATTESGTTLTEQS